MALPRIIYDATCPVCTNFMHMIRAKVKDRAEYYKADEGARDFKYVDAKGASYSGTAPMTTRNGTLIERCSLTSHGNGGDVI